MMWKGICKSLDVHTTLKNGEFFLLRNKNIHPSVLSAHSAHMKET